MIFKAIKSWLLFEKELRSVDKEIKKAGVNNQAKYYTPVFDEKGFRHWMKKGERTVKNLEKYVKEIAHDILCASSESGSDVEQVMPEGLITGFADFDESYESEQLKKVVEWLMSEVKEQ